ncbi:class I SAM-dependent methyltransferase [Rhodopila sp.]|uniref:class I SAM-dependent methyltransferase n=1 Tax=Rhodopila sp. TaxID=2480087 RepID=UPI003D0EF4D3
MSTSRTPDHFARLYESNPDPWGFQTDPYEQAKYRRSIEVLEAALLSRDGPDNPAPRARLSGHDTGKTTDLSSRRFTAGLEVGCSIGVLTRMLAPLCDTLLGLDIVDQALEAAVKRCADRPWVRFQRMRMPDEWPDQRFDLILFSEVLYFLTPHDIRRCADRAKHSLLPGARVLLVNWLGQSDDPCSGDQAAEHFIAATAGTLSVRRQDRQPGYRLDLLTAP